MDIEQAISQRITSLNKLLAIKDQITNVAEIFINCFNNGNKVLVFGNGGSAADSQHFATELVVKFKKPRAPLAAIALTTDTSILTACSNDFGYGQVFSKQIKSIGKKDDVALAISTSGRSENIIKGIETAKHLGLTTILLTGEDPPTLEISPDICVKAPSRDTAIIQELHSCILHLICSAIDDYFS